MAFTSFEQDDSAPLAEINMVPMIDVMLVLLIIFIITAPLLTHAVKVDLPRAQSEVNHPPPEHIQIGIDADARIYWSGEAVSLEQLAERMRAAAAADPRTELQLRADQAVAYRVVAQVMSEAARHGLARIGFVTEPATPPR
ncbi:MAG: biopolymer transporter ExbD [Candidatus Methylophosphatis roskildensis]